MLNIGKRNIILIGAALLALAIIAPASADTSALQGTYFKVEYGLNPDFQRGIDGGPLTGLVNELLGPNGLPVASAYGLTHSGGSGPITDVDAATGEILWWSAAGKGVQFEKTQVDSLDFNFGSFYPDGQGGDYPFYRTAYWRGSFTLPTDGQVTFGLGADDDAFVFVDGALKVDNGGIKGMSYVPNVISGLNAGTHTLDIFFADRCQTGSAITLTSDVKLTPRNPAVPEASTVMLAIMGLGGVAANFRRLKK